MKKSYVVTLLIGFFTLIAFTYSTAIAQEKVKRNFDKFDALSISISSDVEIKYGSTQSVEIEADKEDLGKIITVLEGSKLKIKREKGAKIKSDVKIYITTSSVNTLSVAGSSDVHFKGSYKIDDMNVSVAGSGDINFDDLNTPEIIVSIAGSGDMKLASKSPIEKGVFNISGSGDVSGFDAEIVKCNVSITGSGECSINAKSKLTISIVGSGSVTYKGSAIVQSNIIGSGDVKKVN